MTVPPGDDWEAEYPPVDTGFYSVYAPDDYDYSDYDEEWGTFNPEVDLKPEFNIRYDMQMRQWICDCPRFETKGACIHSYQYRGEEIVPVNEEYL